MTAMQIAALSDLGAPPRAVTLYAIICAMSRDGKDWAYATAATLAARMNCSKSTYARARVWLEDHGAIAKKLRPKNPRRNRSSLFKALAISAGMIAQAWQVARQRKRLQWLSSVTPKKPIEFYSVKTTSENEEKTPMSQRYVKPQARPMDQPPAFCRYDADSKRHADYLRLAERLRTRAPAAPDLPPPLTPREKLLRTPIVQMQLALPDLPQEQSTPTPALKRSLTSAASSADLSKQIQRAKEGRAEYYRKRALSTAAQETALEEAIERARTARQALHGELPQEDDPLAAWRTPLVPDYSREDLPVTPQLLRTVTR